MKNLFLIIVVILTIGLYYLSVVPYSPTANIGDPSIKSYVDHFIAYLFYGIFVLSYSRYKGSIVPFVLLVVFVGVSTEVIQHFVPTRVMDFLDVGVNIFGGIVGLSFSRIYEALYKLRVPKSKLSSKEV